MPVEIPYFHCWELIENLLKIDSPIRELKLTPIWELKLTPIWELKLTNFSLGSKICESYWQS